MISYALPKKDFESISQPGTFVSGWFVDHNDTKGGDPVLFEVSSGIHDLDHSVLVDVQSDLKWLRLLHEIEVPDVSKGVPQVRFSYAAESDKVGPQTRIGSVGIFECDKKGYYKLIAAHGEPIVTTDTKVSSQGLLEVQKPVEEIHKAFLVLELNISAKLKLFDFELLQPESQQEFFLSQSELIQDESATKEDQDDIVVPYRVAKFNVSQLLAHLNDNIDRALRKQPLLWINSMLTVAIRNEDYETALGLVDHAIALSDLGHGKLDLLVDGICKTLVAYGDDARLEEIAVKIARSVASGPQREKGLATFLNALGHQSEHIFSVNSMIAQAGPDFGFDSVVKALTGKLDDHLLLANYYRPRDREAQHKAINAYMQEFDLPFSVELGEDDSNVLKGLQIHPKPEPVEYGQGAAAADDVQVSYQPLVSVITAAYNCASTIDYALKSLLSQNYSNIELLIADDESDDETLEKLKAHADHPNIRIFKSDKNQGPYNIRNALIQEAKGDLITFHDSDDFALPHRIEAQVNNMVSKGTLLTVGRWIRITPDGHFVTFPDGAFMRMCVNSIMFHKKLFDLFGPYRSVLFGADSEFYEKARGFLAPEQVGQVEIPGVLGLWSSSSLTKTSGIEANERGYRSPKRRLYAGLAGRQRVLGDQILPNEQLEEILQDADIYRQPHPVTELK